MADPKIVITAEDRFSAVMRRASGEFDRLQSAAGKLGGALTALGGPFAALGGLSAGAALAGIGQLVGAIDDLDEAAQGLGITATALADLRVGAQTAGVGADQLDRALTRLNVRINEAVGGDARAQQLFRALGIQAVDASGKARTAEAVLGDLADVFRGIEGDSAKAALAVEIFGEKLGPKFVAFLNQGADGLKRVSGVTQETVEQAARLQGEIDKLSASWTVFTNTVTGAVVPAINTLIERIPQLDFGRAFDAFRQGGPGAAYKSLLQQAGEINDRAAARQRQLNEALALGAGAYSNEGRAAVRSAQAILDNARAKETNARANRAVRDSSPAREFDAEFQRYLRSLQDQSTALDNLTAVERVLRDIQLGRLGNVFEEQTRILVQVAEEIDRKRELAQAERAAADAARERSSQEEEIFRLTGQADEARKIRQAETLERLIREGRVTDEQAERAVKAIAGIRDEQERTNEAAQQFGLVFASSIGQFIESGGAGGAKGFLESLTQDLLKLTTQLLIVEPIARSVRDTLKGLTGPSTSGSTGGGITDLFAQLFNFGGARALGGPVMAGSTYLVGERGPELFRPQQSGQIVPNNRLGGSTTINVSVPGGVGRETASQLAGAVSRRLAFARFR